MGGGIFILGGQPMLAGNIVRSNFAGGAGGGIGAPLARTLGSAPAIRGNSVLWNVAGYRSGGIGIGGGAATLVENNTVVGNSGGGIACIDCGGTIARNIIAESAASSSGLGGGFALLCLTFDGAPPAVECNILWNNAGGDAVCGTDGGGNLVADPRFCASDPGGTGLRFVRPDSPALPQNNSCGALIGATDEGCAITDAATGSRTAPALGIAPNPPRTSATITYSLGPDAHTARLVIYDSRGRVVAQILEGGRTRSEASMRWDGRDGAGRIVGAGVYVVRLETGDRPQDGVAPIARVPVSRAAPGFAPPR